MGSIELLGGAAAENIGGGLQYFVARNLMEQIIGCSPLVTSRCGGRRVVIRGLWSRSSFERRQYFSQDRLQPPFFLKQIAVSGLFDTRFQQGFVGSSDFKVLSQDEVQLLLWSRSSIKGFKFFPGLS